MPSDMNGIEVRRETGPRDLGLLLDHVTLGDQQEAIAPRQCFQNRLDTFHLLPWVGQEVVEHIDDLADIVTGDAASRELEGRLDQRQDEAFDPVAEHAEIALFHAEQGLVDVARQRTVAADDLAHPALHAVEAVFVAPERIVGIEADRRERASAIIHRDVHRSALPGPAF